MGSGLCPVDERRYSSRYHAGGISAALEAVGERRKDPEPSCLAVAGGPKPGGRLCQERLSPEWNPSAADDEWSPGARFATNRKPRTRRNFCPDSRSPG